MNTFSELKKAPLAFAVAMGLSCAAFADETMDTVVVTASRTEQTVANTLAFTSVITREDIERSQPSDVAELLHREAGMEITRGGGKGSATGVFLRGAAPNQTVFMVDGVRMNTNSSGGTSLELIDVEQIDHIEIVRGPVSSLYGNDAIGGVVQIFTRNGDGAPRSTVKVGAGTDDTQRMSFNNSGRVEGSHYSVTLSNDQTKGYKSDINQTDTNHYRNSTAAIAAGHDFDAGHDVGVSFTQNQGSMESPWNDTDFDTQAVNLHGGLKLTDALHTALTISQFQDDQTTYSPWYNNEYDTQRNVAAWQTDYQANKNHLLTLGLDYSDDEMHTNQAYEKNSRINKAVFLQDQMQFDQHSLKLGARHDGNSQYGSEKTWNMAYGYALKDGLSVFSSLGTAFKAPTFNDLYFPFYSEPCDYYDPMSPTCVYQGNTDLKAEQSRSVEFGVKADEKRYHWSASVYETRIKNLVDWTMFTDMPVPGTNTWTPYNIHNAIIQGMDLTAGWVINDWRINTNATFLNPKDDDTGERLNRRSKRKLSLDVDNDITAQWAAGVSFVAYSNRPDNGYGVNLAGYNTVDLRTSYKVSDDLKLTLKMENAFDTDYSLTAGTYAPGRTAMLTAQYTF